MSPILVNGRVILRDDEHTGERSGRVLRSHAQTFAYYGTAAGLGGARTSSSAFRG